MSFTFDDIKQLLGKNDQDLNELQLVFSIRYPVLSAKDIFSFISLSFEKYHTYDDDIIDKVAWTNKMYSGKTMLEIQEMNVDPKINCHSTYIFRNLFMLIRDTSLWDKQVKSKVMMKLADRERRRILAQLKKTYRDTLLQDKFEIICEFINLIEYKTTVK